MRERERKKERDREKGRARHRSRGRVTGWDAKQANWQTIHTIITHDDWEVLMAVLMGTGPPWQFS